ncbi:MAG: 50S ribosomal protein L3, partial [Thermodesulfobacteriota bacterium]
SGKTKGRGFSGVIKRWGFGGGPGGHGSKFHRAPGSMGASADPARVFKGKKLPGRMGGKRITVQNLMVVDVRPDDNIVMVKGAIPGSINSVIEIRKSERGR